MLCFIKKYLGIVLLAAILSACQALNARTDPELAPFYGRNWGNLANSKPVYDKDFPDPDLIRAEDGTYYAFATIAMGHNIQAASSKDLLNWTSLDDALPSVPPWALKGDTWAPDVTQAPDGNGYLMYFVAHSRKGHQCIGVAHSSRPAGPFTSDAQESLICQASEGGSIDPAYFQDVDGKNYLLWKNDGNSQGLPTWLYIQMLGPDGQSMVGDPVRLITTSLPWEGDLVEAPTLFYKDHRYYLFYSASAYYDERYAVGVAISDQLLGPYEKRSEPFLSSNMAGSSWKGPGGQDIVIGPDGDTYLAFHGWDRFMIRRAMYLEKLYWVDGLPSMSLN